MEENIKKEWIEIDKNDFLLKVYEVLHKLLGYFNILCIIENNKIVMNNKILFCDYNKENCSEIICDVSVGKYSELADYLSICEIKHINHNNVYDNLLKLIYIYNNVDLYIFNNLQNNTKYIKKLKIYNWLQLQKNKNIATYIGTWNSLIKWAPYHGYEFKFSDKGLELLDDNMDNILSSISSEPISTLIKNCLIETNFQTKETYMSKIAIEMAHYLNTNGKYKIYFVDENIFTSKFYKNLERENNGYFRHTLKDSGDKEKTEEWINFNENEKLEIINQKLIIYSFILAMIEKSF